MEALNTNGSTIDYSIERQRSRIEGLLAVPVAGGNGAASFIRVHNPIEMETVFFSAIAQGKCPTVPSPESLTSDNNRVFMYGQQSAVIPVPTPGGHYFVIVGFYVYNLIQVEGLSSNFNLGRMPWETTPPEMIPSQFFSSKYGLVTDQSSVALPPGTLRPR